MVVSGGIGSIFHPPEGKDYKWYNKWYILPIGGLYATYHLLGEPETSIESTVVFQKQYTSGIYIYISGIFPANWRIKNATYHPPFTGTCKNPLNNWFLGPNLGAYLSSDLRRRPKDGPFLFLGKIPTDPTWRMGSQDGSRKWLIKPWLL